MINYKFYEKKAQGSMGVNFFVIRHNELIKEPIVLIKDMEDWNIEGSDLVGERLSMKKVPYKDEFEAIDAKEVFVPYFEYGGIEVKTIGTDQFLPRFGINDLACGTLGFPLWSKTEDLINGWTGYIREDYGNLKRWMEPTIENRGARPICLVHLLKTNDYSPTTGKEYERFFAAVIFEDVGALLERLTKYLARHGVDLRDWNSIPIGEKAKTFKINGLFLQGNMVHVPLDEIKDLATVTLIGDDPVLYRTGKCSIMVQQSRLEYLKDISEGRWIPQKRPDTGVQTDKELMETWNRKLLLGKPQYHGLMDRYGRLL